MKRIKIEITLCSDVTSLELLEEINPYIDKFKNHIYDLKITEVTERNGKNTNQHD